MASNMSLLNLGYELTDSEDEDVSNQGYDPNALPLPLPTDLPSDFVAEESPIIAEDDSTLDELPTSVLTVDPILVPTEDSVSDSRPDSPEQEAIELQETIDATDEIDATDAEDSQIQLEDSSQKSKPIKNVSTRILTLDTTHIPIQPESIIEYEWPPKSGENFFIQEQICQLLNVNSFKRKYPELMRRTIEPQERNYLVKELGLSSTLPSNHFTALHSLEVHDLMSSEYPQIYQEYQKACANKVKRAMIEKQRELDLIKLDAKKMEELRRKAIQSAADFNSELQAIKKSERQYFWDVQTNIIQSPLNKWLRVAKDSTTTSNYPVFLIPGQYTSHYKIYSSEELRQLPLGTVLDSDYLFPPKRAPSPPPIRVTDEELNAAKNKEQNQSQFLKESASVGIKSIKQEYASTPSPSTPKRRNSEIFFETPVSKVRKTSAGRRNTAQVNQQYEQPSSSVPSPSPSPKIISKNQQLTLCIVCQEHESPVNPTTAAHSMICCSSCQQYMHSCCIDMPPPMAEAAALYNWCCIDCKNCSVCDKPDQEESMMCCDACDRGYHTFCIGLSKPPTGVWHCKKCTDNDSSKA